MFGPAWHIVWPQVDTDLGHCYPYCTNADRPDIPLSNVLNVEESLWITMHKKMRVNLQHKMICEPYTKTFVKVLQSFMLL